MSAPPIRAIYFPRSGDDSHMSNADPFFCESCDAELEHDDLETIAPVLRIEPATYELHDDVAEVYLCDGCGEVIGFDLR